jgi:hypothetical protein
MSDGEEGSNGEESEEDEETATDESVDAAQKEADIEKDIALLRDIGLYITRTSTRITKRILHDIEMTKNEKKVERKEGGSQTDVNMNSQPLSTVNEHPPPPPQTQLTATPMPQYYSGIGVSSSHYQNLSDSERSRLVNEAISVLLNENRL